MDFLQSPLISFYKTRNEIFEELKLKSQYPTFLFISSFSCTGLTKQQKNDLLWCFKKEQLDYLERINIESKYKILDWISQYIEKNPNCNFIYRPHPGEIEDEILCKMQIKFPQFFVLNQYSVKQWILICDKVFTWMSTSAVDAYFAKIPCAILRPIEIKEEKDMVIFKDSKFIRCYNEFQQYINNSVKDSLNPAVIKSYYNVDKNKSYLKIADLLEKVLKTDNYNFDWDNQILKRFKISLLKNIINESLKIRLRPFIYKFYDFTSIRKNKIYFMFKDRIELYKKVCAQKKKDFASKRELNEVDKRIKEILIYKG